MSFLASSSQSKTTRCRFPRWMMPRPISALKSGLPLANARAVCPDIQVFDADEAADAQALNAIADWCDRFTPLVALDSPAWPVPRHHRLRASVRRRGSIDADAV